MDSLPTRYTTHGDFDSSVMTVAISDQPNQSDWTGLTVGRENNDSPMIKVGESDLARQHGTMCNYTQFHHLHLS